MGRSQQEAETQSDQHSVAHQSGDLARTSWRVGNAEVRFERASLDVRDKGTCTTCAGQGRSGIRLARKDRLLVSISIVRSERGWNGCGAPCLMQWRSSNFSSA